MPLSKPRFMRLFGPRTVGWGAVERNGDGQVTRATFAHELACHDDNCEHVRQASPKHDKPGSGMIDTAVTLMFLLAAGLLAVSYAAQYRYILHARHQIAVAFIMAGALDVGLLIFSLLALGLAKRGVPAKRARAGILFCALGSAAMNFAAADVTSPRSILAYVMAPVFLAFVVDVVVWAIRRHVLGLQEGRSVWWVVGMISLYALRLVIALPSTCTGLRRWVLAVTPLPDIPRPEAPVLTPPKAIVIEPVPAPDALPVPKPRAESGASSKRDQLVALALEKYPNLATLTDVEAGRIGYELGDEIELNKTTARRYLREFVLAAQRPGSIEKVNGSH
jgi:hypothetical protein